MLDKKQAKERIAKLRQAIDKYRYAYHVENKSLISDEALDALKKELFDLEQQYPDLITPDSPTQRVAGKPLKEFKKVRHERPMISLNDAFSEEDVRDWLKRIENYLGRPIKHEFYCEHKIDGLSVELVYENGIFTQGSTRGDGQVGEDITQNLKTVQAIPLKIDGDHPKHLVVRGEVSYPVDLLGEEEGEPCPCELLVFQSFGWSSPSCVCHPYRGSCLYCRPDNGFDRLWAESAPDF